MIHNGTTITCPRCGLVGQVPGAWAGQALNCPRCTHRFAVGQPVPPAAHAAVPQPNPAKRGAGALDGKTVIAIAIATTGASAVRDRIVEVAAVKYRDGVGYDAFETLVNPCMVIPFEAAAVHGIRTAMTRDKPRIEEVVPDLAAFCADADFVAMHDAEADLKFLRLAFRRAGDHASPIADVVDTCAYARVAFPDAPNHRLATLKDELGIGDSQHRRAFDDAVACAKLLYLCHDTCPQFMRGTSVYCHW